MLGWDDDSWKIFFSSFEQQAAADDVRLIEAWLIMEGPILHNVLIILILFKQYGLKRYRDLTYVHIGF